MLTTLCFAHVSDLRHSVHDRHSHLHNGPVHTESRETGPSTTGAPIRVGRWCHCDHHAGSVLPAEHAHGHVDLVVARDDRRIQWI